MNPALFSLPLAENGPGADPFTGISSPFLTIVLILVIVLLLWWLLRAQTAQVEPVHVDHDGHDHGHGGEAHAAVSTEAQQPEAVMAASAETAPAPEMEAEADSGDTEDWQDVPPPQAEADDLTKLEGIGPKVQIVLNAAGIKTFDQLGSADVDHLQELLDAADYQYMDPGSWPEQARLAAAGDWEALQKLQDELSGGR